MELTIPTAYRNMNGQKINECNIIDSKGKKQWNKEKENG